MPRLSFISRLLCLILFCFLSFSFFSCALPLYLSRLHTVTDVSPYPLQPVRPVSYPTAQVTDPPLALFTVNAQLGRIPAGGPWSVRILRYPV